MKDAVAPNGSASENGHGQQVRVGQHTPALGLMIVKPRQTAAPMRRKTVQVSVKLP